MTRVLRSLAPLVVIALAAAAFSAASFAGESPASFADPVRLALRLPRSGTPWEGVQRTGLTVDVEWDTRADQQPAYDEEGLVMFGLAVRDGVVIDRWRSDRLVRKIPGRLKWEPSSPQQIQWDPANLPRVQFGDGFAEARPLPHDARFLPARQAMRAFQTGSAEVVAEAIGETEKNLSYVALVVVPVDPDKAERTETRPLIWVR